MEKQREKQREPDERGAASRKPRKRYVAPEVTDLGDVTKTTLDDSGGGCGSCGGGSTS